MRRRLTFPGECATKAERQQAVGLLFWCLAAPEMRVWPLGIGLQDQVPNHLKLLRSKAVVVSVEGKGRA